MTYSGIFFGIAIVLMHACICQTQAEGGVFSIGTGGTSRDLLYQREIRDIKTGLESYDLKEAYPDDSTIWHKLIAKDIAANIGVLLERSDDESFQDSKKRAVIGSGDRSVPLGSRCRDDLAAIGTNSTTGDCSGYVPLLDPFGLSDDEDNAATWDDGMSVASGSFWDEFPRGESDQIHLAATLSASAYMADEEIFGSPEVIGNQVDEYPVGYRHSLRTVGGNEPTLFRIWRFKDHTSTLYVSFLGIVDKAVYFSDLDTHMAPLSQSSFIPTSPSKRRYGQVSVPKVHKAFLHQFLSMEEHLRDFLEQSMYGDEIDRIVYTGHSIGGAIATIAATVSRYMYPDIEIDVITFGSPRVGDSLFAEEYSSSVSFSLRVVLQDDVIPSVYPIKQSFKHVPEYFCIDCDDAGYPDMSPGSRMTVAFDVIAKDRLKRHTVGNYIRAIEAMSKRSSGE